MQEVLMAIKRPHTDRIFAGTKTVELRRTVPRYQPGSHMPIVYPVRIWMYESKTGEGAGAIVGYFDCPGFAGTKGGHLREIAERAQVTMEQLRDYAGAGRVYGWMVTNPTRLPKAVPLSVIGLPLPPQSWRYMDSAAADFLQEVADHAAPGN